MITHCPHCGRPLFDSSVERPFTDEEIKRFWKSVRRQENGCWIFEMGGPVYGRITVGGRYQLAHRVSWKIHRGPIPYPLQVLHNCPSGDNPRCVNPDHLKLGTGRDNVQDMIDKGRSNPPRGSRHPYAKLDTEKVDYIRNALAKGTETIKSLSCKFGLTFQSVYYVAIGKTWRHIGGNLIPRNKHHHLTAAERIDVKRQYSLGLTQTEIAKKFGVNQSVISKTLRRLQSPVPAP